MHKDELTATRHSIQFLDQMLTITTTFFRGVSMHNAKLNNKDVCLNSNVVINIRQDRKI